MGITGLLPFLDKASERINIRTLANKSVAIDSYCWLHKGAFAVGDKLARGEQTDVHIKYCLKFVDMLLSHNIKPILVFDGRHLPAKAETEAKRRESRQKARQLAVELMRKGNHREASKHLRRCVDITHEMALQLIKTCRAMNVDCIVAPYEADAQLAYLNKIGLADYVITEDSDLTLFGCRKILFKLDLTGSCVLVDADKLHLAMDCHVEKFTMDKFRLMCILSGCDYIDSLPGIGLAKACKFVMKTEETDIMRALDKIPAYLNMRQLTITEEYKINVLKARATFLHMVVFDPRRRKQVRLNEIEELGTEIEYCSNAGEILDDSKALNLAVGNLNPFTLKKLDDWHPDQRERPKLPQNINTKGLKVAKHPSMWHRDYRWTTSINATTSSTSQPKSVVKKSPRASKAPKRLIDKLIESDDEKLPTESQNDDLVLNQYISFSEPSQKRFKDESDRDEQFVETEENGIDDMTNNESAKEQITPNRNPFKKSNPCTDELLSPTRISKENNSLVKTQSPVKHIDYRKLEKLSRFSRTMVTDKQRVISRFFNATPKVSDKQKVAKIDSGIQEDLSTKCDSNSNAKTDSKPQMKSPNLLESFLVSPKSALYFSKSNRTASNNDVTTEKVLNNDKTIEIDLDSDISCESQRSILDKFKFVLKSKIDEVDSNSTEISSSQGTSEKTDSESTESAVVLSDDDESMDYESISSKESNSQKTMWLTSSQKTISSTKSKKTTTQRKKSTSSNKSSIKSNVNSAQSRLSMFGFQKKPQVQP